MDKQIVKRIIIEKQVAILLGVLLHLRQSKFGEYHHF